MLITFSGKIIYIDIYKKNYKKISKKRISPRNILSNS